MASVRWRQFDRVQPHAWQVMCVVLSGAVDVTSVLDGDYEHGDLVLIDAVDDAEVAAAGGVHAFEGAVEWFADTVWVVG